MISISVAHSPGDCIFECVILDAITYNPVCRDWQISRCNSLGLNFHYGNNPHHGAARNEMIGISQRPIRTGRISADGNCFFRCISFINTGSQDYHEDLRLLVTTYMAHNSSNDKLSILLPPNMSMQSLLYLKCEESMQGSVNIVTLNSASSQHKRLLS